MRALSFDGELRFEGNAPRPRPGPDEALIRVSLAGICGTDLEIVEGYKSFHGIMGHEFVGVVEDCEDPKLVGCRVCGEINISCGECATCLAGMPTHCERRTVIGIADHPGAFADYLILPVRNLHPVPDAVPDEAAVFVEPLAAAFRIVEQIGVPTGTVVVLGDGRLGSLCALALKTSGADPLVVGKHTSKLKRLAALGLRTAAIDDELPNAVDVVVEATGSPAGIDLAMTLAKPRGTVVLKTTVATPEPINLTPAVVKELVLIGSRCGPFAVAIDALARHQVSVETLITACLPIERGLEAFDRARRPQSMKVLLSMRGREETEE